ncbi:hypothetical protein BKA66DRAFT_457061 [Pyrenochaeta sp. MPI-SDFR-AT-0127]|nr:hypothetical protein BKA66DRAFT_457061 [Pyrenochaeta sp. MPI-SDFR-AT-0127]
MKHSQRSLTTPFVLIIYFLVGTVLADRYRFSVTNITTISTREWTEDHLFLAISSSVGDQSSNNSHYLGWNHTAGSSVVLNNLTHEIYVPYDVLNVSVAFILQNLGNEEQEEGAAIESAGNIIDIIANAPGVLGVGADIVGFFFDIAQLFNCSGPVAIDSVRYTNETLAGLSIGSPVCDTKPYETDRKGACGKPNYTVSYCLERLDNDNAGVCTAAASTSDGIVASRPGLAFFGLTMMAAVLLAISM